MWCSSPRFGTNENAHSQGFKTFLIGSLNCSLKNEVLITKSFIEHTHRFNKDNDIYKIANLTDIINQMD